jgi:hypothetical protein
MATGNGRPTVYYPVAVTEQNLPPPPPPAEAPVDPLYTHAAAPFLRTEAPAPVAFASPPSVMPNLPASLATYKFQIQFGLAFLAYLMVVVGCATVVQANQAAQWRYYVALLPVVPAGLVIWLFVRALARLDEVQKRIQIQAFGFALGATALLTFGYGFLEGVGLPHLNWTLILPLITLLWAAGNLTLVLRQRYRR